MPASPVTMGRRPSNALIVHPEWYHTLPLDPITVSFWDECCDAVLTQVSALQHHNAGNTLSTDLRLLQQQQQSVSVMSRQLECKGVVGVCAVENPLRATAASRV